MTKVLRSCYWMKGKSYEEMYGPQRAAELRLLRSVSIKKRGSPNRGKTYIEIFGKDRAKQLCKQRSISTKAARARATIADSVLRAKRFRQSLTSEVRNKISVAHKGKVLSIQTRSKIAAARARRKWPFNNTKPEQLTAKFLRKVGLRYRSQFRPLGLRSHAFDFRLVDYKVLIDVDGCWWYGCKIHYPDKQTSKRDVLVTSIAKRLGWTVVRIWEHDVLGGKFVSIRRAVARLGGKEDADGKSIAA